MPQGMHTPTQAHFVERNRLIIASLDETILIVPIQHSLKDIPTHIVLYVFNSTLRSYIYYEVEYVVNVVYLFSFLMRR